MRIKHTCALSSIEICVLRRGYIPGTHHPEITPDGLKDGHGKFVCLFLFLSSSIVTHFTFKITQ